MTQLQATLSRDGKSRSQPSPRWIFVADSHIHGQGVFSRRFIRAGSPVLECRGLILHRDQVGDDARAMQIGPDTYLVEDVENPSVDDFLNHSCKPNLGFVRGSLMLYALRDIKRGEELLFDYSTTMNEPGWAIRCRCRAQTCRGKVQSYCDLPAGERNRLRGVALAYLRHADKQSAADSRPPRAGKKRAPAQAPPPARAE